MASALRVSVESLQEHLVQEVSLDGQETFVKWVCNVTYNYSNSNELKCRLVVKELPNLLLKILFPNFALALHCSLLLVVFGQSRAWFWTINSWIWSHVKRWSWAKVWQCRPIKWKCQCKFPNQKLKWRTGTKNKTKKQKKKKHTLGTTASVTFSKFDFFFFSLLKSAVFWQKRKKKKKKKIDGKYLEEMLSFFLFFFFVAKMSVRFDFLCF